MSALKVIYDNGGRSFDRYFAIFDDGGALAVGSTGNVPNGFCMAISPEEYVEGDHLGEAVELDSLPEPARKAVLDFEREWYSEVDKFHPELAL